MTSQDFNIMNIKGGMDKKQSLQTAFVLQEGADKKAKPRIEQHGYTNMDAANSDLDNRLTQMSTKRSYAQQGKTGPGTSMLVNESSGAGGGGGGGYGGSQGEQQQEDRAELMEVDDTLMLGKKFGRDGRAVAVTLSVEDCLKVSYLFMRVFLPFSVPIYLN